MGSNLSQLIKLCSARTVSAA